MYIHYKQKKGYDILSLAITCGALYRPLIEEENEYWRFIVANFLHIDTWQLWINVYAIYYVGNFIEQYVGWLAYSYIILMACLVTMITIYCLQKRSMETIISLGAGGIFNGLLGALLAIAILMPDTSLLKYLIPVIGITFFLSLWRPQITKTGYLGGFVGGFLAILILSISGLCIS